jgi:hypothetical protein
MLLRTHFIVNILYRYKLRYYIILVFYDNIPGENLVYEKTTAFHNNSAVVFNLQCGVQNTKDNMVISLFNEIIEESCINVLRTQVKAV